MKIFIELFIFLSTIFPIFHMVNAFFYKKKSQKIPCREKKFSILIPCYNEEDAVRVSINGLLAIDYKNYEVIYINDGSSDNTLNVLKDALDLEETLKTIIYPARINAVYQSRKYKNFYVIDKQNGGKSEALNIGTHFASANIVVTLDADSVLKHDALGIMNRTFEDSNVVAAGGSIHIMQGYDPAYIKNGLGRRQNMLVSLQILEYIKGFYIYKMSLSKQRALAIISGAFGVFKKDILQRAGGFRKTLGEDIDITMRIQKLICKTGEKIMYLPEALCYTQCPENWHDLKQQRIRWQKGFIECMIYHKRFLLKTFLVKSLSFHFFIEAFLVGLCSCLFTVFTYVFTIVLTLEDINVMLVFLKYFLFCVAFSVIYSASAMLISAKYNRYSKVIMKKIVLAILMDLLFYRYFNLFIYIGGTISYFWNADKNHCWNKVMRNKRDYFAPEAEANYG